jgi:hypothetical protein
MRSRQVHGNKVGWWLPRPGREKSEEVLYNGCSFSHTRENSRDLLCYIVLIVNSVELKIYFHGRSRVVLNHNFKKPMWVGLQMLTSLRLASTMNEWKWEDDRSSIVCGRLWWTQTLLSCIRTVTTQLQWVATMQSKGPLGPDLIFPNKSQNQSFIWTTPIFKSKFLKNSVDDSPPYPNS